MKISIQKLDGRWHTKVFDDKDVLIWSSTHNHLLDALETLVGAYKDDGEG